MERRNLLKTGLAGGALAALACTAKETPLEPIPQASLSNLTANLESIPAAEYESRVERVRSRMAQVGCTALILESGPSLEYFSGIRWGRSERPLLQLVGLDGDPVVIAPAFELERAKQQFKVVTETLAWEEHESPYRLAGQVLSVRGRASGRVAVEGTTRLFVITGLKSAVPKAEFVDGSSIVESCRMRKSTLEISRIRLAGQITKQAFASAFEHLQANMKEDELGTRIATAHSALGARGGAMVLFGPSSALPHGSAVSRELQEGDVVLADGGCLVQGYNSDVTRTVVFGKPNDLQRKVWQLVFQAQSAAIDAVRPGISCGELDRIARTVIEAGGYGPGYRFFTHRLGHGIGLEGHEAPYLVWENDLLLEPGMVVTIEPGVYLPGEWGIRIEDDVVVTEAGCEVLGDRAEEI